MVIPATMTEQVSNAEDLEISYRVLHPSAILRDQDSGRNIEFSFSSLSNKYKDFLDKIVIQIELDDINMNKYRYKPKMVSNDLYGTTELWNDILILNQCFRTCDFQPKLLKVYDPQKLKALINEILLLEDMTKY